MNITEKTIEIFENETGLKIWVGFGLRSISYELNDFLRRGGNLAEATSLQILGFEKYTDRFIDINFIAPKNKEITVEYLFNKVDKYLNRENCYQNLSCIFKKILPSCNFYATTYGIGVDTLYKSLDDGKKNIQILENFLKENKIEYYTEYSEACWVYRFVISKNINNINKIKNL